MSDKIKNPLPPSSPKLLRIIARLSGGEIKTEEEAFRVAAAFIVIGLIATVVLFFIWAGGQSELIRGTDYDPAEGYGGRELLIVITIIGILSSIILNAIKNAQARARDAIR